MVGLWGGVVAVLVNPDLLLGVVGGAGASPGFSVLPPREENNNHCISVTIKMAVTSSP